MHSLLVRRGRAVACRMIFSNVGLRFVVRSRFAIGFKKEFFRRPVDLRKEWPFSDATAVLGFRLGRADSHRAAFKVHVVPSPRQRFRRALHASHQTGSATRWHATSRTDALAEPARWFLD